MNIRPRAGETADLDNQQSSPTQARFARPNSCHGDARARAWLARPRRGRGTRAMPIALPFSLPPAADLRRLAGVVGQHDAARPLPPMPKKAAVRLWHRARDFDRGTHQPGRHGGAVGHTGAAGAARADLRLPELSHRPAGPVLCGDRPQGRTSACAPSPRRWRGCASSASSTGCAAAPRAGGTAGSCWSRRPTPTPCCRRRQWRGYRPPAEPPAPAPGTWGEPPPMPDVLAPGGAGGPAGGRSAVGGAGARADPKDRLAAALARLGRAFMARDS